MLIGHYQVWEIIGLGTLLGTINAFDVPARQALVYEMISEKEDLPNALALNSSMVNLSRLIGPAIAGLDTAADQPPALACVLQRLFLSVLYMHTDEITKILRTGSVTRAC